MNAQDIAWMDKMATEDEHCPICTEDHPNTEDDIVNEDTKTATKQSVADAMIKIGMTHTKLFHTPDGTSYAAINVGKNGINIHPVNSREVKSMLIQKYYKESRKAPSSDAVRNAIAVLDAVALNDMEEIRLHNRVAEYDDAFVYDMSNQRNESVIISNTGWKVTQPDTPMFKRYAHQVAQTTPTTGGDIDRIFDVVNVAEEDRLMTLVHLVSSFIPHIPHPIPNIAGEHGSAKSTASRILKSLVDPSILDSPSIPVNEEGMHQVLAHHWYIIFDNVSWIQDWQSDILCKAVTGAASQKRVLYSDDTDFIQVYKNCVGFNGITSLATRGDLIDRSISIRLNVIDGTTRKTETDINTMFTNMKGGILGAIFDTLSKSINIYKNMHVEHTLRMADFTRWGCAIAVALGHTAEEFMEAYYTDNDNKNMDAIESTPVAGLIIELMEDHEVWRGTPTELWETLKNIVVEHGDRIDDIRGMKNVTALGMSHDRIAPNLRNVGLNWEKNKTRYNRGYIITHIQPMITTNPEYPTVNRKRETPVTTCDNLKSKVSHKNRIQKTACDNCDNCDTFPVLSGLEENRGGEGDPPSIEQRCPPCHRCPPESNNADTVTDSMGDNLTEDDDTIASHLSPHDETTINALKAALYKISYVKQMVTFDTVMVLMELPKHTGLTTETIEQHMTHNQDTLNIRKTGDGWTFTK